MSKYTTRKCPWILIYVEQYDTMIKALSRESSLKRANSNYIKWLFTQPSNLIK